MTILKALRPRHWSKNVLLIFPALAANLPLAAPTLVRLTLGFIAFSLVASTMYIANDLVDRDVDRLHPRKRDRPVASGALGIREASLLMAGLTILAVASSFLLPETFSAVLVVYVCLNIAYSLVWKRLVAVDVLILVGFYVLRLVAGATLAGVPLTGWFLAFFVFMLLSVALAKRVAELRLTGSFDDHRGYQRSDIEVLQAFGIGCSITGVLVYCLYITGDVARIYYVRPELLWAGFPLLLYWTARLWLLVGRGTLHEDPAEFATRDTASWIVAIAFVAVIWVARV